MSTSLSISGLKASIAGSFNNNDASVPATAPLPSTLGLSLTLANGAGAGAANQIYCSIGRTLAGGANEVLNLTTIVNPYGTACAFAKIKAMLFFLQPSGASTAATSILIGGHATQPFINWVVTADAITTSQPQIRIRNSPTGGMFVLTGCDATGYAVTATTGDKLTITNEDGVNTATYTVVLIGA